LVRCHTQRPATHPKRGRPQGRKARRDVGWGARVVFRECAEGGVLPSLLVWVVGLVGRNWLQRVLAPRGCGGLTIVLWMLAQLPIGRCAGQSDCEPGPVSVGTRLLHGSTFPRLPWPRPRGDTDCREPVLGKCVLSLGALPSRPVSLLGVLGAEAGRSW